MDWAAYENLVLESINATVQTSFTLILGQRALAPQFQLHSMRFDRSSTLCLEPSSSAQLLYSFPSGSKCVHCGATVVATIQIFRRLLHLPSKDLFCKLSGFSAVVPRPVFCGIPHELVCGFPHEIERAPNFVQITFLSINNDSKTNVEIETQNCTDFNSYL